MIRPLVSVASALCLAAACSSSSSGGAAPRTCSTGIEVLPNGGYGLEQTAGSCGTPSTLTGTGGGGAACMNERGCAAACCACPADSKNAGKLWIVSGCVGGTCIGAAQMCCSDFLYGVCNGSS